MPALQRCLQQAYAIVTPDASHKPLILQALKAGMHVICEKPLALNARDDEEIVDAAKG
ncbi:MAG: Gfo/Idh/MocA family oxidoreductase [Gammaproteobacteria bacterium]